MLQVYRRFHRIVKELQTEYLVVRHVCDNEFHWQFQHDKEYPRSLYEKQFSLYVDNIVKRIELQEKAYAKEEGIPNQLFDILASQKQVLSQLKTQKGSIVSPDHFAG